MVQLSKREIIGYGFIGVGMFLIGLGNFRHSNTILIAAILVGDFGLVFLSFMDYLLIKQYHQDKKTSMPAAVRENIWVIPGGFLGIAVVLLFHLGVLAILLFGYAMMSAFGIVWRHANVCRAALRQEEAQ